MAAFRLLAGRTFGLGTLGNFLLAFALYGSSDLLLQHLAVSQGFDAQQSGEVMASAGAPQLIIIPFVPLLVQRIDSRRLVGIGLAAVLIAQGWFDGKPDTPPFGELLTALSSVRDPFFRLSSRSYSASSIE